MRKPRKMMEIDCDEWLGWAKHLRSSKAITKPMRIEIADMLEDACRARKEKDWG